jgi:hypothetical protein
LIFAIGCQVIDLIVRDRLPTMDGPKPLIDRPLNGVMLLHGQLISGIHNTARLLLLVVRIGSLSSRPMARH